MNKNFTAYDKSTGRVLFSGHCLDPFTNETQDIEVIEGIAYGDGYISDGVYHSLPEQPSLKHVFNYTTKQWEDPRTLTDLQNAKWAEIKKARESEEFGQFTWDGSSFDSDLTSQSRIQGASQLAQIALAAGQPFSIGWTLADNTSRTLDAGQMIAVGIAMGAHISTCHERSRLLRQQIYAATTAAEVEAITW